MAKAAIDAVEAAFYRAYQAVEDVADMILDVPAGSAPEVAMKAMVLFERRPEPAALFHDRPQDLHRFIQEVRSIGRLD